MKKRILPVLGIVIYLLSMTTNVCGYEIQNLNCNAAIVMQQDTGDILYSYNSEKRLPMASVTKLMTYYVFMRYAKDQGMDFNQKVRVSSAGWNLPADASAIGLENGEELTIEQLIEGMLIVSANDFATAIKDLYEINGGSMIEDMNETANSMGLSNTSFVNVTGLTGSDGSDTNFSSARDLAILSKAVIAEFPETLDITSRKTFDYKGKVYPSTNNLMSIDEGVDGLKTGYTQAAGYCLTATKEIEPKEDGCEAYRVITVVLGCQSEAGRAEESEKLLQYTSESFLQERIISSEDTYKIDNPFYKEGTIAATPKKDVYMLRNTDDNIVVEAKFKTNLTNKIQQGDEVGVLVITNSTKGTTVETPLYAEEDYNTVNFFVKLFLYIKRFIGNIFGI